MSNLIPERKPIRLPFSTRTPDTASAAAGRATPSQIEQTTCGICGKVKSKYVCPRCNVFYCSLDCFRSETHTQCSEPFYRSIIESEITSNPASAPEDKRKMLELLRRFEQGADVLSSETDCTPVEGMGEVEGQGQGEQGEGRRVDPRMMEEMLLGLRAEGDPDGGDRQDDEEEDYEEERQLRVLRENLAGLDIAGFRKTSDNLPPDQLLSLLPPSHRAQFLAMLDQPESSQTKALLEEVGAEESKRVAWWRAEHESLRADGDERQEEEEAEDEEGTGRERSDRRREAGRPAVLSDVEMGGVVVSEAVARKLIYNILAVCLSYIPLLPYHLLLPSLSYHLDPPSSDASHASTPTDLHAREKFSTSSSSSEQLRGFLAQLAASVPFLEDPNSTVRLGSVGTVVELAGGYLFQEDWRATIAALSEIAPLIDLPIDLARPHPFLLILSDLYWLYTSPALHPPGRTKPPAAARHAARKIVFYAHAVGALQRRDWERLSADVVTAAGNMEEQSVNIDERPDQRSALDVTDTDSSSGATRITMLP